ncbi:MAG: STAS-like domain-containing protein [Cyanothece sp. SIO1E1]|nr:STAS-like domain-containing protein [Cyanothece sp. SIO1E1]
MAYKVYELTGEYAMSSESGQKLYDLIHPELLADNSVELDFSGVNVFASAFFNFAIGQLLKDISSDDLNRQLSFTALNTNGHSVLRRVIENAKRYYSDQQYREAVDVVLEEYASSF